ncbi:MAG: F0F1 ATP synthase subunit epsilon [Pseudomonadota bacterium]
MRLKVLLPTEILVDEGANKIIAEAENGLFCIKPRHIDFVAPLVPGLLFYVSESGKEHWLGVDEGTLVKCGPDVWVSVRDAVREENLAQLKQAIEDRFYHLDEAERVARSALARLEAGVVRRFIELREELP